MITQTIGLLVIIKRRKVNWYGHVSCKAKNILQGSDPRVEKRGGSTTSENGQIWGRTERP